MNGPYIHYFASTHGRDTPPVKIDQAQAWITCIATTDYCQFAIFQPHTVTNAGMHACMHTFPPHNLSDSVKS